MINKMKTKQENGQFSVVFCNQIEDPANMEQTIEWDIEMRELLLDLEEKIEQGQMGRLPDEIDRLQWREQLLESGDVSSLIKENICITGLNEEVVWDVEDKKFLSPAGRLVAWLLSV